MLLVQPTSGTKWHQFPSMEKERKENLVDRFMNWDENRLCQLADVYVYKRRDGSRLQAGDAHARADLLPAGVRVARERARARGLWHKKLKAPARTKDTMK